MEAFPWWSDEQKELGRSAEEFVESVLTEEARTRWTRVFPRRIFSAIAERGFCGAGVPVEYGGMGLGATGTCIVIEALNRMPGVGRVVVGNMLSGLRQILEFGSPGQKARFLPRIAQGEFGAIVITEPFAGTDAAALRATARREGDHYVLRGKKRFIVSAGVADRYFVYAVTSDDPALRREHRHLSAFVVERGTPRFTVEKLNEVMGFENIQNGVLDFDGVEVPVENRIGAEGDGWRVMTAGLNFERTLISAQDLGWFRELLGTAIPYAQRRVQFGRPTGELVNNQLKAADLILRARMARLITYYTAYLWDLGRDITIESNIAKVFNCEGVLQASLDAIQLMGGDGLTPFYPPANILNIAKVENISGGTMEACRLVIYRSGLKQMKEELRMPRRVVDEELGVPVPAPGPPTPVPLTPDAVLRVLGEEYRVDPGLFTALSDLAEHFESSRQALEELLVGLEAEGLVELFRDRRGIALVKATYEGLSRAYPKEHYRWFPSWATEDRRF